MQSSVRAMFPDLVQAFSIVLLLGFSLGLCYVHLAARVYDSPIPYFNLGLLFFLFLIFFVFGRIPIGLIAASSFRNFLGPASLLMLSLALFLFRNSTGMPYLMYSAILLGLSTTSGTIAATTKLSEDFNSHNVASRKQWALAAGSVSFPFSIGITTVTPIGFSTLLPYIMLIALVVGAIFLCVALFRFFIEHLRPTQDTLYNIVTRTIAPLRAISGLGGKDYFLTALSVDTLFTFSAWAIVIYLPYYYILVTGSVRSASVAFTVISALYIAMRFLGQRVRSSGFEFFSYFIRPIAFIFAFFLLSLAASENVLFYSLLILCSVGLFEDGAKRYVLTRFDEDDRQIVQRSMQVIKTPFTIFAPAFAYAFFSISFSLGFASAIVPAAISLLIMLFSIGNPASEGTAANRR